MLLLSVVLAFSAVACNGPGKTDDTISYFDIITTDSGHGSQGTRELARRFEEKFANYSFAEGKQGVKVTVEAKGSVLQVNQIADEEYHAYVNPYSVETSMIASGSFINLDEIFKTTIPGETKTIDDKIPENYKQMLQGASETFGDDMSKQYYYFAPGVSFGGGLTYDKKCFDDNGYYFVAPEYANDQSEASYKRSGVLDADYYFADVESELYKTAITTPARDSWEGWNANRYLSCGPDGVYGTYDDGMPSSLEELIVLCEKIKDKMPPFILSGQYKGNMGPAIDGLINSLLGPENAFTMKTFESDSFEVVTGYQANTSLWGMNDVAVPVTTNVKVTEQQGYYTTWSSARYYATAFFKLAVENGWFTDSVTTNKSHEEAENELILNGYAGDKGAILLESSYWVNESQESTNYIYFDSNGYADEKNGGKMTILEREKEIKWLSLPRQITGTVAEGNGTPEVFMYNGAGSNNVFNAKYKDDPEVMEIIKQWLLFIYSDESLQYLTASTGCPPNLIFDRNIDSDLYDNEPFYKDLFTRLENGVEVHCASDSEVYNSDPYKFQTHYWNSCWTGLGNERKLTLYEAFDPLGKYQWSIYKCFEGDDASSPLLIQKDMWGKWFQADEGVNALPPSAAVYPDGHPNAGQEVIYSRNV